MKNLSLWLLIVPLLIVSCTADTIDSADSITNKSGGKSEESARLVHNLTPENPANAYDIAGKLNNDILDVYLASNDNYDTTAAISQQFEAITSSSMTYEAKLSLSSFMSAVLLWENAEYEQIHQAIISYESSVMAHSQFNIADKRIILTTSSMVRYSLFYVKERKDKDWESIVGNRVGGGSDVVDKLATAAKMALITRILQKNLAAD